MKKVLILSILAFFAINASTVQAQSRMLDRIREKQAQQQEQAATSSTTTAPKALPTPIQHLISGKYYPTYKISKWYYRGSGSDLVYYVDLVYSNNNARYKTAKFDSQYNEIKDVISVPANSTNSSNNQPITTPKRH
ncbi:MAG: hypothetical protein IKU00_04960 [Bacteroidales bacterium]|nr:hypothetical protein [Bacteroidales bacterium]